MPFYIREAWLLDERKLKEWLDLFTDDVLYFMRRLAAFEATFGGPTLFDRLPEGLRLSAAGEQLVPAAESVEDAVLTLERRRAAASPVLSGTVRVSTGECAAGFLARCLSGPTTTALPSGITLELIESRQTANLARREADMALRHEPPESGDFYVPKLGAFACAVYQRRGADAGAWVTYTDERAHYAPARWVQRHVEEWESRWRCARNYPLAEFGPPSICQLAMIKSITERSFMFILTRKRLRYQNPLPAPF